MRNSYRARAAQLLRIFLIVISFISRCISSCFIFEAFERSFEATELSFKGFERKFGGFEYVFLLNIGNKVNALQRIGQKVWMGKFRKRNAKVFCKIYVIQTLF